MKRFSSLFLALSAAMALAPAMGLSAQAQQLAATTPIAAPIEKTGQSGGADSSTCGNVNLAAGQSVRVTEPFAAVNFEVRGQGDYTLLITGPEGFKECVFAHNYDGGIIQSPGLLTQGEYQLYVGDRRGESHPYTLSISQ